MRADSPALGLIMGFTVTWFTIPLRFGAGHPAKLLLLVVPALCLVLLNLIYQIINIRMFFIEDLLRHFPHGLIRVADEEVDDELCQCHLLELNYFSSLDKLGDEVGVTV